VKRSGELGAQETRVRHSAENWLSRRRVAPESKFANHVTLVPSSNLHARATSFRQEEEQEGREGIALGATIGL